MNAFPIEWPAGQPIKFCRRWKIVRLELFGSALRANFQRESDIDFLATFAPHAGWSLSAHFRMERELAGLLDRSVDLVTRPSVERSRNAIRREHILQTAQPVYVEG